MRPIRRQFTPNSFPKATWLSHPLVVGAWILMCIFVGISLIRSGLQARRAFEARRQAEASVHEKEVKGLELMEQLKEANTPFATEKIIRDELNLQLPGEVILQLPSPSP